jgi:hypothetical protein
MKDKDNQLIWEGLEKEVHAIVKEDIYMGALNYRISYKKGSKPFSSVIKGNGGHTKYFTKSEAEQADKEYTARFSKGDKADVVNPIAASAEKKELIFGVWLPKGSTGRLKFTRSSAGYRYIGQFTDKFNVGSGANWIRQENFGWDNEFKSLDETVRAAQQHFDMTTTTQVKSGLGRL